MNKSSDIVLEVKDLGVSFEDQKAIGKIDLSVARGEFIAILGPSGCGKSTLLRAIIGTHPPRRGEVLVDGTPVEGPGRDRGVVYQQYALFPFLTAQENVAVGLTLDQTSFSSRWLSPLRSRALRRQHLEEALR